MGSASGQQIENVESQELAKKLGAEIAKRGHIFLNGACPGLPHHAMLGAKEAGGLTVGVSPAFSEHEHVEEYRSPMGHDMIMFTGLGFMERDVINIRSSDAIVIIGGGIGTLNEFTIAYDEGRPIGVLTETGGISDHIEHIVEELCHRKMAPNIVQDPDPIALLEKLEAVITKYPLPIHEDGRVIDRSSCRRGDWWCQDQHAAG